MESVVAKVLLPEGLFILCAPDTQLHETLKRPVVPWAAWLDPRAASRGETLQATSERRTGGERAAI
ncbi:hypothetical protein J6590_074260 [Homalodisca vitripennis]|nr:hypothetical protein J6590_074260 [Homalodisca vitripennis]